MNARKVERVVVVGRDAPLWIAAVSLKMALGKAGVDVRAVQLPSLQTAVDAYAALPSLKALHRLLGVEEEMLFQAARAVPMVGQRYAGWSGSGPAFMHAFDSAPAQGSDLDFVHYWTKARGEGMRVPFEDFSLGAVAARHGRVPMPPADAGHPAAAFGYHLDARRYTGLLRQLAAHRGVPTIDDRIAEVERVGDTIAALRLAGGERVQADLFVDATGPEAALLSELPGGEHESWAELFPCDRLLTASAQPLDPLPAYSQVSAFRAGWAGLFPLQDRTAVVAAYASRTMADEDLAHALPVLTRMAIDGEAIVSDLRLGCRRNPWVGNCVAIGEAAISLEPLDAIQLHVAHLTVSNLIALFPAEADKQPEAQAYNRLVRTHGENLRDFQLAHYRLNRRFDEPMWDAARAGAVPETLAPKFAMFSRRGLAVLHDHETFEAGNWAAILIGHGLVPDDYDPRVDLLSEADHIARVQERLRIIGAIVPSYPTVAEHLAGSAARTLQAARA